MIIHDGPAPGQGADRPALPGTTAHWLVMTGLTLTIDRAPGGPP